MKAESRGTARRRAARLTTGLLAVLGTTAWGADSLGEALTGGRAEVDLRYRFEQVDQDGFPEDAHASTLRLRLGYRTGSWHDLVAFVDVEAIEPVGADTYNSTANGRTDRPVVADPEGTEVNQAFLGWSRSPLVTLRLGRQRIKLDNDRFIGNVGFRQNEQTYDALSARGNVGERFAWYYAHLENANRIWGEDHPDPVRADLDLASDLMNASYRFDVGTLVGYAYLLDIEDSPSASHRNLGLRFQGRRSVGEEIDLLYTGELAQQSDYDDGSSVIDADYRLVELGVTDDALTAKVGYEVLGGDGDYGFQTPLATLHAFNGWTDRFLVTPDTGLQDLYLALSGAVSGYTLRLVYHDFDADAGGASLGDEWGLAAGKTFRERYAVQVEYASYDADAFSVDVNKLWITLQLRFQSKTGNEEG